MHQGTWGQLGGLWKVAISLYPKLLIPQQMQITSHIYNQPCNLGQHLEGTCFFLHKWRTKSDLSSTGRPTGQSILGFFMGPLRADGSTLASKCQLAQQWSGKMRLARKQKSATKHLLSHLQPGQSLIKSNSGKGNVETQWKKNKKKPKN